MTSSFLKDPDFPLLDKPINVNDFVVNVNSIGSIVPMSVGVVKSTTSICSEVFFIGRAKCLVVPNNNLVVIDIFKTGKEEGTYREPFKYKICNICHILKVQSEDFERNQNDGQGRPTTRPSCRNCRVKINGKNMTKAERQRMERIKPKPYELFECPICHKLSIPGVTANIVIDHDHRTGLAREWICDSCNTGIGRFQDNPEMLYKIAAYIKKHNEVLK